jgi:hypothetical protein
MVGKLSPQFVINMIRKRQGKLFFAASIRGRSGTLPMNWSVPAARLRLGHFSLSEAQGKFEK